MGEIATQLEVRIAHYTLGNTANPGSHPSKVTPSFFVFCLRVDKAGY